MRSLPAALIAASLPMLLEIVERVDLRADEALLEVGVDHAGRLGRGGTLADRPGADLLLAGREVRLQARAGGSTRARASPARAPRGRTTASSSPRSRVASSASSASTLPHRIDDAGAFLLGARRAPRRSTRCRRQIALADVAAVEHRLGGQQAERRRPLRARRR